MMERYNFFPITNSRTVNTYFHVDQSKIIKFKS